MNEELLRHVVARGEQHRRPVHAVEAQDVLAEQVPHVRPEAVTQVLALTRVRQRAQVVDEGVDPDVGDLPLVPGDRDAPRLPGPADAEVLEAALDEAPCLVVAKARQHEVRALVVELEQAVLVGGEAEEVVLLLDVLRRDPVLGHRPSTSSASLLNSSQPDAVEARRRRPRRCRRCRRCAAGSPARSACGPRRWCG